MIITRARRIITALTCSSTLLSAYWPYVLALLAGLMLIIAIQELSLFLPRSAGMIR